MATLESKRVQVPSVTDGLRTGSDAIFYWDIRSVAF